MCKVWHLARLIAPLPRQRRLPAGDCVGFLESQDAPIGGPPAGSPPQTMPTLLSKCRPRIILWHHAVTFLLLQIPLKHPSLGVYTCYVSLQFTSFLLSVLHFA